MAATSLIRGGIGLLFVGAIFLACGVDLKESTPGAFGRCEPTAAQYQDFHTNVFSAEISTQCSGCHQAGTAAVNGYKYSATISSDADKFQNYCYHYRFNRNLVEFPQSAQHASRYAVTADMIPALISWVNGNFP